MFKKKYNVIALLILSITLLFFYVINNIEAFNSIDSKNTTATEKLNHSNTMYWYSRALGNTNIEFEEARKLANESIQLASKNLRDSLNLNITKRAKHIVSLVDDNREQNELTVNNRFPFFIDLMGKNKTKEEDFARDKMDQISTYRALDKLIHLNDFSFSKDLSKMPYFTIINHQSSDNKLEESAVQYLNLNTSFYTISDHEISQIFNDVIPVKKIVSDSLKLKRIADFFDTKQILIIDIIKNDQYKGVYYYAAKAKRFDLTGEIVSNKYIETFVKERQFNTIFSFKLPIFLFFIGLMFLIYFCTKTTDKENLRIKPIHFLISIISSIVFSIIFLELIQIYLSPTSGEFYETDASEIWRWIISLTFTFLPFVLVHLIIGKMDHYIEKFDSGLDIRRGVFSIFLGTFMSFPMALAYYGIIRFSIDYHLLFVLLSVLLAVFYAYIISYFWIEIKNIPQESSILHKRFFYTSLITEVLSYIMFVYNIIGLYTWENTIYTFVFSIIIPNLFLLILYLILKKDFKRINKKKENFKKDKHPFIISNQYDLIKNSLEKKGLVVLYGIKGIGKTKLASQLQKDLKYDINETILIDFSKIQNEGDSKVNYFPFADGFRRYLSYRKFNNHADEARKSGNIIGKLLNSITSIGQLLVIEKTSEPEEVKVISKQIFKILDSKDRYLLVFDNVHLAKNENEKLLFEILDYFKSDRNTNKSERIIFTANEYFNFKNNFENLIETIVKVKINRNNLFESNFFHRLIIDNSFIEECIRKRYNFDVFDYYDLLTFFEGREIDKVPGDIIQILDEFDKNKTILKEGDSYKLNLDKVLEIPSLNNELSNFEEKIKLLSNDEMNFLLACVYSADQNEAFEINSLAYILKIDRIVVLQKLRLFEEREIIFDIKDRNDWFRFSDSRYILAIKKHEGYSNSEISQLGKEFFKGFVSFYSDEINKPAVSHQVNLLNSILNKTLLIGEDLPKESIKVLNIIGSKFLEPEISHLQEAESAFNKALDLLNNKENYIHFENVEEVKEDILVKKLLKTYELKNDFENNNIKEIIEKYKHGKYKNSISQFEYLQFSKSRFFTEIKAKEKQNEINDKLQYLEHISYDHLRLKFNSILLSPRNGVSLNALKEINSKYEELLSDLELCSNNSELNYLFAEVLNARSSLIVDNILGNKELDNNSDKNTFFTTFKILVAKRLNHELKKVNDESTDLKIKEDKIDDNIYFLKAVLCICKKYEDPIYFQKIDRKGLCFTYNFIVRSSFSIDILKNKEALDLIIKISNFAVSYNKVSNDIMGLIMSENFHGKLLILKKEYVKAFQSLEYAYYISHKNGKFKGHIMSDMEKLISENFDENLKLNIKSKIKTYTRINLIQHILRHFPNSISKSSKINLRNQRIVNNDQDLELNLNMSGSKFLTNKYKDPFQLLDEINVLIENKEKKYFLNSVYYEINSEEPIGVDNLISIEMIQDKSLITKDQRSGYEVNCIDADLIKENLTNNLIVILDNKNNNNIITAWPGTYAPDFPRPIKNINDVKEKEAYEKCANFWRNHAFIIKKN